MITNDFRFMNRGQIIATLNDSERKWLEPVTLHHTGNTERALLLFHGFSSSPAVFRYLIPQITAYDAIFAPLLPGHGDSIKAFDNTSRTEWLTFTEDTYQSIAAHYKKVDVLGLSLGGLLAYRLSQIYTLNHLFLLAPALHLNMALPSTLRLLKLLHLAGFYAIKNKGGDLYHSQYTDLTYRQLPIHAIIELLSLIQETTITPPSCPLDLFLGCHDKIINTQKVASLWSNTQQANLHWLPQSAHVLPLDQDATWLANAINQQVISQSF